MEESPRNTSAIARYWPVLLVAVVIVAVVAVGALRGGDDESGDEAATETTTEQTDTTAEGGGEEDDALSAPDCDPETGRIMIPSVYAPNCVPLWEEGADNGGATHPGVTADEIVVVVYDAETSDLVEETRDATGVTVPPEEETAENRLRVVETFNALYETYGRTVRVEVLETAAEGNDEAAARADAIRAAEELGAFAVIGGPTGTTAFADELVAREVLCFCTASQPIEYYLESAPYVWSGLMASTQGYVHRADYITKRLAGKPAEYAGDVAFHETERTFALVWYETADGAYAAGAEFFEERMAESGVALEASIPYILGTGANMQEDAQGIIARLKEAGVTSVIFAGDPFMPRALTAQATAQEYFPEWIITGSTGTDSSTLARLYDPQQWSHAFGISFLLPPIADEATQSEGNVVSWHLGEELSSYPGYTDWQRFFTGVHLAGPNLTPETFRDGMFSFLRTEGLVTQFGVSYGTGLWDWDDYLAADDVTEIWWDPEAEDPNAEGDPVYGMYRYVNGAQRFGPGEIGDAPGVPFEEEGTVIFFEERPESDQPPQYPRRAGRAG